MYQKVKILYHFPLFADSVILPNMLDFSRGIRDTVQFMVSISPQMKNNQIDIKCKEEEVII